MTVTDPSAVSAATPSTAPAAHTPDAGDNQAVSEDDEVALALSLKSVMTQSRTGAATEIQPGVIAPPQPAADGAPPETEAALEGVAASLV